MSVIKSSLLLAALFCAEMGLAQADTCACRSLFPTAFHLSSVTYGNGQFVTVGEAGTILASMDGETWTCGQPPTQDNLVSVTFGNGLFVAVSPACGATACSGTIITSVDGINWVLRPHGSTAWGLNAVAFGNGQFVGVCAGASLIVSSTNGTTWVERPSGTQANLTGIAFGQGQFVVVSDGGQILTSTNGANWVQRQSGTTADFEAVAYGDGQFVAVSFGNGGLSTIITSMDGVNWVQRWSGAPNQFVLRGVGYGNGLWIAVSEEPGSFMLTSHDAVTWIQREVPKAQLADVAYGNGQFVAVGEFGTILTSVDGLNWVPRQSGTQDQFTGSGGTNSQYVALGNGPLDTWTTRYQLPPATNSFGFVAYGNGQFVAVGSGVSGTSADGVNWTFHQSGPESDGIGGLAYGNGLFVAVAAGDAVFISTDGVNWVANQTPAENLYGIGYGNGLFVAVGQDSGGILTSSDGVNWTQQQSPAPSWLEAVAFGNGQFVAVSWGGTVVTSSDGTNWVLRQSGTQYYLDSIAFGNGRFVAVDLYGGTVTSTDGVNWVSNSGVANTFSSVAYGGGQFVAASWSAGLYTTSDGAHWTQRQTGVPNVFRVAYGDGQFVALGGGASIVTSSDGVNWIMRQPPMPGVLEGIGYGNGQFVAVGEFGAILTSADGRTWTRRTSGIQYDLSGIAFGNGQFVAIGPGSSASSSPILTSMDGTNWVPNQFDTQTRLSRVTFGNGQFAAVGFETTSPYHAVVLTSANGSAWAAHELGTQWYNAITYGNGQFMAVGNAGGRATSTDGVNWVVCQPGALVWLDGVASGNGRFVAVGGRYIDGLINDDSSESALITSADGGNWTRLQPPTTNVLSGIAYGYGQFVAVGNKGTLLTSADGVDWIRRNLGRQYSGSPFAVAYGNGQFMALGENGTILGSGQTGPPAGPLGLWIDAGFTNAAPGYGVWFTGWHTGTFTNTVWDFGDGTVLTNESTASHAWSAAGLYIVRLTAYNDSYPSGVTATLLMTVSQPVCYVNASGANPIFPYGSWETAATTIQDAIGAGRVPGRLVLVTNGVYQSGAVGATNDLARVALTDAVVVRSVNGPEATVIEGDPKNVRCAFVGDGSVLSGFSLTNGTAGGGWGAAGNGGGVRCEPLGIVTNCWLVGNLTENDGGGASGGTLFNCTLTGNSANNGGAASGTILHDCGLADNEARNNGGGADQCLLYNCILNRNSAPSDGGWGGGASFSIMYNCMLTGNWAGQYGGGAFAGNLYNCTLSANAAQLEGGGAYSDNDIIDLLYLPGTLNNCIVYSNTAPYAANHSDNTLMNYCCTTPMPTNGVGNITDAPLFLDSPGGNLRLQSSSPCINAGNNASAPAGPDLDGNARTTGGTVDMGAYEFQTPASRISYAWLQNFGLPTDGSADFTDPDGDGMDNWQEWRCGTDPTSAQSALRMRAPILTETSVTLTWESVAGVNYFLLRGTNPVGPGSFAPIASTIQGQAGTTSFTDTRAVGAGPFYYRVGVGN